MNSIILVVLFVCGQPDTIIVKYPDSAKTVTTHQVSHPKILEDLSKILAEKPIVITYEEDRGTCA